MASIGGGERGKERKEKKENKERGGREEEKICKFLLFFLSVVWYITEECQ